jgi:ADP-heptose:LPS heptosyltransferase
MRVLILEPAKLGDFIQSTPLIEGAIKRAPRGDITILAREKSVMEAAELYYPELKRARLLEDEKGSREAYLKELKGADVLINLSMDPRAVRLANDLSPKNILGPHLDDKGTLRLPPAQSLAFAAMTLGRRFGRINLTDIWRSLIPSSPPRLSRPKLGKESLSPPPSPVSSVNLEREIDSRVMESLEKRQKDNKLPLVAFHLGAANHLRRFPAEEHARLASLVFEKFPFTAVTLGSPAERALSLKFKKSLSELNPKIPILNLSGETDLQGLALVLQSSELLVSSDTGVAHLGASLETPTLSIFMGPALSHETGPYGEKALILQGLAPCGPCVENKGCERKLCRAAPGAEEAAALALLSLTPKGKDAEREGEGEKEEEAEAEAETEAEEKAEAEKAIRRHPMILESFKSLVTQKGITLLPIKPYEAILTDENLAALIFGRVAKEVLFEEINPNESGKKEPSLASTIAGYKRQWAPPDLKKIRSYLSFIAKKGLGKTPKPLSEFQEKCEMAMKNLKALL